MPGGASPERTRGAFGIGSGNIAERMHADEAEIDATLVARLVASQFPQWAHLPVRPVMSAGTDNAIYRLGPEMAVRLPRRPGVVGQGEKEARWLPLLAPRLPLPIPVPLGVGAPAEGFPWSWSVCRWVEGETPALDDIAGSEAVAAALGAFVTALWQVDATDGPPPGADNAYRGVPLARRDRRVRECIAELGGMVDGAGLLAAWDAALAAPVWDVPPRWLHGDLLPGNLLVEDGRLSAVIDFGCLGAGDPACDVMPAWTDFTEGPRRVFREAVAVDEATWARARGWALSFAVIALPYYLETNPVLVATARHTIREVLEEFARGT